MFFCCKLKRGSSPKMFCVGWSASNTFFIDKKEKSSFPPNKNHVDEVGIMIDFINQVFPWHSSQLPKKKGFSKKCGFKL